MTRFFNDDDVVDGPLRLPPGFSYVLDDSDSENAVDQDEPVIYHQTPEQAKAKLAKAIRRDR